MRTKAELDRLIEAAKRRYDYIEAGKLMAERENAPEENSIIEEFKKIFGGFR